MKIKTTKQMRLDELLKYAWDNEIDLGRLDSDKGRKGLYLYAEGANFGFSDNGVITKYATFTVSTEEELTEETNIGEYGRLIIIHRDSDTESLLYCDYVPTQTIKLTREMHERNYNLETIGLITEKAELITVWRKDAGIPEEGVIEV